MVYGEKTRITHSPITQLVLNSWLIHRQVFDRNKTAFIKNSLNHYILNRREKQVNHEYKISDLFNAFYKISLQQS